MMSVRKDGSDSERGQTTHRDVKGRRKERRGMRKYY